MLKTDRVPHFNNALTFLRKWNLPITFHNICDYIFGKISGFPECCIYFFIRFYSFPDCSDYYDLTINSTPPPGYVRCPYCMLNDIRFKPIECPCNWKKMGWVEEMLEEYMVKEVLNV